MSKKVSQKSGVKQNSSNVEFTAICVKCDSEIEVKGELLDFGECSVCGKKFQIDLDCEYEGAVAIADFNV